MSRKDTLVKCTACENVYAAFYTPDGDLRTPAGTCCPNCESERFLDVPETGL